MQTFAQLDMDPRAVLGLFPGLLPAADRASFVAPSDMPALDALELETATGHLVNYLMERRNVLATDIDGLAGSPETGPRIHLAEVVDTALLQCYLRVRLWPGPAQSL
jgi:hypothetical protein